MCHLEQRLKDNRTYQSTQTMCFIRENTNPSPYFRVAFNLLVKVRMSAKNLSQRNWVLISVTIMCLLLF